MQGRIHKQKHKSLVSAQSLWSSNTVHPLVPCWVSPCHCLMHSSQLSAEGQGGLS